MIENDSTKEKEREMGHGSPKQTPLTGNLCSGDPHFLAEIFLRDALKPEALPTQHSFLPALLSQASDWHHNSKLFPPNLFSSPFILHSYFPEINVLHV